MSELAAEAGVSVGSIYRLFRDKDDLIVAVVRSNLERQLQALDLIVLNVRNGVITPDDGLHQFIHGIISYKNGGLSLDIQAESYRNPTVADEVDQFYRRLRDMVRELAYFSNPELQDQRLDDAQEAMLGIAFRPNWSGPSRTHLKADADSVQEIRIITKMLQAFWDILTRLARFRIKAVSSDIIW
jgi:TetR/AcrR family transcriptional repressor of uid operon